MMSSTLLADKVREMGYSEASPGELENLIDQKPQLAQLFTLLTDPLSAPQTNQPTSVDSRWMLGFDDEPHPVMLDDLIASQH
jgi:hypothetical protein